MRARAPLGHDIYVRKRTHQHTAPEKRQSPHIYAESAFLGAHHKADTYTADTPDVCAAAILTDARLGLSCHAASALRHRLHVL